MLNTTTNENPAFSLHFSFPFVLLPFSSLPSSDDRREKRKIGKGRKKEGEKKSVRERKGGRKERREGEGREETNPSIDLTKGFYFQMSIFRQLKPIRSATKGFENSRVVAYK
jgi:hypothetical protein